MPAMTELGQSEPASGAASPAPQFQQHTSAPVRNTQTEAGTDDGTTLAQTIAQNIAISMAQWVQSQASTQDGTILGRDRQMVEAVAAAASAAAAAAASAVIAAAGEDVQAKIHQRTAQGALPFHVQPFTDLVPPLIGGGPVNPIAYQQQLNLLACDPNFLQGFLPPQQQQASLQGRQQFDALMSLGLDDMWNGSAIGASGLHNGFDGQAGISGQQPLSQPWAMESHPFGQVSNANARIEDKEKPQAFARPGKTQGTRVSGGKDTETGTGTGTGTRTRGTGNSITEEPAVHFVNAGLRDCAQPGGVGGEGSEAGNAAKWRVIPGAVKHHHHHGHHHHSSSSKLPPGVQFGMNVASNQMGKKRHFGGTSSCGGAGQKSHNTEVPMMSDSDHARIQDFINDGNYFHQQRSGVLLGGSGAGGGGTGSGGDSGRQPGDQQEETLAQRKVQMETPSGRAQESQQLLLQQGDGSGTGSGSQQVMPPSGGKLLKYFLLMFLSKFLLCNHFNKV